jgi:hypothetical protein
VGISGRLYGRRRDPSRDSRQHAAGCGQVRPRSTTEVSNAMTARFPRRRVAVVLMILVLMRRTGHDRLDPPLALTAVRKSRYHRIHGEDQGSQPSEEAGPAHGQIMVCKAANRNSEGRCGLSPCCNANAPQQRPCHAGRRQLRLSLLMKLLPGLRAVLSVVAFGVSPGLAGPLLAVAHAWPAADAAGLANPDPRRHHHGHHRPERNQECRCVGACHLPALPAARTASPIASAVVPPSGQGLDPVLSRRPFPAEHTLPFAHAPPPPA